MGFVLKKERCVLLNGAENIQSVVRGKVKLEVFESANKNMKDVYAVSLFSLHAVGLFMIKLLKECYLNYSI